MSFENFPYSNFHDLNLDWIINQWADMKKSFATYEEAFADLKNFVDSFFENLNLQEEVNKKLDEMVTSGEMSAIIKNLLTSKKYIFIGDSYGTFDINWVDICANSLKLTKEEYYNLSVAETGFGCYADNGFLNNLKKFTGNKNEITDIVVCGGINDSLFHEVNDLYNNVSTHIRDFIEYCRINFPIATISIGYIGSALDSSTVLSDRTRQNQTWCLWCYQNNAISNNAKFLNGCENSMHTSFYNYASDLLHPSNDGSYSIGRSVACAINNGSCIISYPYETISTEYTSSGISSDLVMKKLTTGNTTMININEANIGVNVNSDLSEGLYLINCINIYFNNAITLPILLQLNNFNNVQYQTVDGSITFYKHYIKITAKNIENNKWKKYIANSSAIVSLKNEITLTVPTLWIN